MTTPPTTPWHIIRDFSRPLPMDAESMAKDGSDRGTWCGSAFHGKIVPKDFRNRYHYRTRDASYAQESPASQPEGEGVFMPLLEALERIRREIAIPYCTTAHIYTIADEAIKAATTNQKEVKTCATQHALAAQSAAKSEDTGQDAVASNAAAPEVRSSEQAATEIPIEVTQAEEYHTAVEELRQEATGSPPESVREDRLSAQVAARKHLVESAGYWFKASRRAQREGRNAEAILAMENAYNHVENALSASQADSKRLDWLEKYAANNESGHVIWFAYGEHSLRAAIDAMSDQKEGA